MKKPQGYEEFQGEVFQELKTLESKRNGVVLQELMDACGLTWNDVMSLYVEGMNGEQIREAMWNARKKTPQM